MNILFCSAGRRVELLKEFKQSLSAGSKIIATDMSLYAPAIYAADKYYIVPSIYDKDYINRVIDICKLESVDAVTTLIDPEISILAAHREQFKEIGVEVLAPYLDTALVCFDKFAMFEHFSSNGIATVPTYGNFSDAKKAIANKELEFPLFVKPRTGSGSVGAHKIESINELEEAFVQDPTIVVQKFMAGEDIDADVYIDLISEKPVRIFSKRKLETKIGGASKTVSFKDDKLNEFVVDSLKSLHFHGPIDIDFFYVDGKYYISEINPRFGGAYLHAYGAGVDFVKLIENNVNGIENQPEFGNYEEDVVMMMYDSVVIEKIER